VDSVNRILFIVVLAVGCHLGRPAAQVHALSLGSLSGAAVQPGLSDTLRRSMSDALASEGMLRGAGAQLNMVVLDASTRSMGADTLREVHMARLELSVSIGGAGGRQIVLTGEQAYGVRSGQSLQGSSSRADAFAALSRRLSEQAVTWIGYAPMPEVP
jgi:hypothetical protein